MINNFGAAGSNTSLLLEEWVESSNSQSRSHGRSAFVFALSAKSQVALHTAIQRYQQFLGKPERRLLLKDICYTATARRQFHDHRVAIVCTSIGDLQTKLESCEAVQHNPAANISATVFVFSGQGGLYQGMGEELMHTLPAFKEIIMRCDDIIRQLGCPSILRIIIKDREGAKVLDGVERIIAEQCACVALEYALAEVFKSWGIMPQYVMGHRYVSAPKVFHPSSTNKLISTVSASMLLYVTRAR